MAGSVNKVILVGNLAKDPEVRNSQTGDKIVSFTLAGIVTLTWRERREGDGRYIVPVMLRLGRTFPGARH